MLMGDLGTPQHRLSPHGWRPPSSPQHVVMLVGPPGSGKTTCAERLVAGGEAWVRVSQDDLGNRQACEALCERALRAGKHVVIDRCNFDAQQRQPWVHIARGLLGDRVHVTALCFWVPEEECVRRIRQRGPHPTIVSSDPHVPSVVRRFFGMITFPDQQEGINEIQTVSSDAELDRVLHRVQGLAGTLPLHVQQQQMAFFHRLQGGGGVSMSPNAASFTPAGAAAYSAASAHSTPDAVYRYTASPLTHGFHAGGNSPGLPGYRAGQGPSPGGVHQAELLRWREQGADAGVGGESPSQSGTPGGGYNGRSRKRERSGSSNQTPRGGADGPVPSIVYPPSVALRDLPLLLFDLNGTLTSHTAKRYSSGTTNLRPGVAHLRRLQGRFQLGVYSSATIRTVNTAIGMIEEAAGPGPPLFQVVMERRHCMPAPKEVRQKAWDTCKPLSRYFKELSKVVLLDDDSYKSLPAERGNLVLVPCWDEEPHCEVLPALVTALLEHVPASGDVRTGTSAVNTALAAAAKLAAEQRAAKQRAREADEAAFCEVKLEVDTQDCIRVEISTQQAAGSTGGPQDSASHSKMSVDEEQQQQESATSVLETEVADSDQQRADHTMTISMS